MMRTVFADTAYFVALLSKPDEFHRWATEHFDGADDRIITTTLVFIELANRLAKTRGRGLVKSFLEDLGLDPRVEVVPFDQALVEDGFDLYDARRDKEWSLVDCTSFAIMQERRITEALTPDHHFEQAGFLALMK